jgi:hypothetical protein
MNIQLGKFSGSDATDALHASIREFNVQSSRQTDQMLRLTWVMAILTILMFVGLVVQIYLVFYPPSVPNSALAQPAPPACELQHED